MKKITIYFEYFFPEHHRHWQDKFHGSIQIIKVLDESLSPMPQTITQLIRIRRSCWDYLERNDLLAKVVPLSLYPRS